MSARMQDPCFCAEGGGVEYRPPQPSHSEGRSLSTEACRVEVADGSMDRVGGSYGRRYSAKLRDSRSVKGMESVVEDFPVKNTAFSNCLQHCFKFRAEEEECGDSEFYLLGRWSAPPVSQLMISIGFSDSTTNRMGPMGDSPSGAEKETCPA